MNQRTRRSPARFLAPLALLAVLIAFVMVVSGSGGSDSPGTADKTTETSSATGTKTTAKTTATNAKKAAAVKKAAQKTYTVQAGDSFGAIAAKTGITVEQLQELNPNADSRLLQTGQKLRVK